MSWRERDHPRHPDGRFRDKASGWISAVAGRLRRNSVPPEPYFAEPEDPYAREARRARDTGGFGGVDLIAAGRGTALARAAMDAALLYPKPDMEPVAGRMLYRSGGVGPHGDEALHAIAQAQGFEVPAQVVTPDQMDELIRLGGLEMWRGVETSRDGLDTPPEEIHRRFREGQAYQGLGMAGNGTYMSSSRSEASRYGQTARYALHPDARVVGYRTIQREQSEFLRQFDYDSIEHKVYADTERYAAARGWDAIMWHRGEEVGKGVGVEDEIIVLNRGALVAEAE